MPLLLSLCVPTYRRSRLLRQSLQAILSQIEPEMTEMVEVLVLDNASPDDTPAVVAEAQAQFPHLPLRHVRRPENIGCDANFCESPKSTSGKFVYLLSDDDILLPGAVSRLLDLIQSYPDLDAFSLNVRQFHKSPEEDYQPSVYPLDQDRIITNPDEMLLLLRMHIVFISCIAFRRENVLGRDYADRQGTNMGQSYLFLDALKPGKGVYVTERVYLAQRADNAQGYSFFRVWVTNFHSLMMHAQKIGYSAAAVGQIMQDNLRFLFHYTVVFKTRGTYGDLRPNFADAFVRLLRTYGANGYLWTRIMPVLLTPRFALGLLRGLYRNLRALRRQPVPKDPLKNMQP